MSSSGGAAPAVTAASGGGLGSVRNRYSDLRIRVYLTIRARPYTLDVMKHDATNTDTDVAALREQVKRHAIGLEKAKQALQALGLRA